MRFINYVDKNRIFLVFLSPHSTHRLQPLDVGLFGPLTQYSIQEIDHFVAEYQGYITIFKGHFWTFFLKAYSLAFIEQNIQSGLKATEIYPFNPEHVLVRIIKRKRKSEVQISLLKILGSTRALRRTYKRLYGKGHVDDEAAVLIRAGEKLAQPNTDKLRINYDYFSYAYLFSG